MKTFDDILEESYEDLEQYDEVFLEEYVQDFEGTLEELAESLEIDVEYAESLCEQLKKRVSATGQVTRVKSRAVRSRRAGLTTGMSKTERQKRARKAAKTRRRNPGMVRKAVKKRRKALRRRSQMGIK